MMISVLVVDDDELLGKAICDGLVRRGMHADMVVSATTARARLERGGVDVVLLDVHLAGVDGIALCGELARRAPRLDILVMSGTGTVDRAVAAVRAGALDFVTKPFSIDTLAQRIRDCRRAQPPVLSDGTTLPELLGASPVMQQVRALMLRIASTSANVLINGESGTGKEIVARGLHRLSRRASGPFVAINCAALPEPLLESELFGYARGAFTDARADRAGLFSHADGGTLFLDEIGEMPRTLQPKLLRALEERSIRPIGATAEVAIDVRVLAATHRDLAADVEAGRFRADLYYRLNALRLTLPPLRDRKDDIAELARHFARSIAAHDDSPARELSADAIDRLRQLPWPGNVRELRNCIEHAVAMATGPRIEIGDLPPLPTMSHGDAAVTEWPTLEELERGYLDRVLTHVGGNRSAAARLLGIDRRTLMRKLAARRGEAVVDEAAPGE
ncbi:MAG: sigma-54-dependent Fis family transcriptional regulator [Myxococcales bacterium]|nr:sigma-54-dependent Fis family transcriptional regulator [Myxococcales bacterium]